MQGEGAAEEERLDVFGGPEGRLSVSTDCQASPEIPQVYLARCDV